MTGRAALSPGLFKTLNTRLTIKLTTLYLATKKSLLPVVARFPSVGVPRIFPQVRIFLHTCTRDEPPSSRSRVCLSCSASVEAQEKTLPLCPKTNPRFFLCCARFPATTQLNFHRVPLLLALLRPRGFRRDSLPSLLLAFISPCSITF